MIVVVSETGLVYTYATPSLKAIVDLDRGREFIGLALKGELRDDDKPIDDAQQQEQQPQQQQQQQRQQKIQQMKTMDLDVDDVLVHSSSRPPSAGASGENNNNNSAYYSLESLYPASSSAATDSPIPSASYPSIPTGYSYPDSVYPTLPASFASRSPHPLPDQLQPQPAPSQTPFEHALTSHKIAFDTYTARASEGYSAAPGAHGAHQFSDVARNWKLPRHARTASGQLGATLDTILPGTPPIKPRTSMDERRNTARGEHGASLLEAKAVSPPLLHLSY